MSRYRRVGKQDNEPTFKPYVKNSLWNLRNRCAGSLKGRGFESSRVIKLANALPEPEPRKEDPRYLWKNVSDRLIPFSSFLI